MKIYKLDTASDFEKLDLCLAIGNFDGIHKGCLLYTSDAADDC